MGSVNRLPREDEGVEGIIWLADQLGDKAVFEFIRMCRKVQSGEADVAKEALTRLAQRMVRGEQEKSNVDRAEARRIVAADLGYTAETRTNFNKIEAGQRRADRRWSRRQVQNETK